MSQDQWLVVRQRPFGTLLTASPWMPIATHSRPRPIADVNTGLELLFQSRMKDNFPRLRFPLVPDQPMGFSGKLNPGSSSTCLKNPMRSLSCEIWVSRLPSNLCDSRQTDLGFEFPATNYPWHHRNLSQLESFPAMFFWPGDRQTNKGWIHGDPTTFWNFFLSNAVMWRRSHIDEKQLWPKNSCKFYVG